MKSDLFLTTATFLTLFGLLSPVVAQTQTSIYETPREFHGQADFDGDGRLDWVIVDRESGKYRVGFQRQPGQLNWVDNRPTGIKAATGFTIGSLVTNNLPSMAFTSPDANKIVMLDASNPGVPGKPITVPFSAGLGPNALVAVDIGGAGNTPLADLVVASMYNSPDENQLTLVRNDGKFDAIGENVTLSGSARRANRVTLEPSKLDAAVFLEAVDGGETLRVDSISSGTLVPVAKIEGLAAGSDYAIGNFGAAALPEVLIYKPGVAKLDARPFEKPSDGKYQFSKGNSFELGEPIRRVLTVSHGTTSKLFVIFGEGTKASVFDFDGVNAPKLVQELSSTNEITAAAGMPTSLVVFSQAQGGKFSNKYQVYALDGNTYSAGVFGSLPTLADNDNIIIPDIYSRIEAKQATEPAELKGYTNTIPGTRVSYAMVPIQGGELVMGSPDSEKDRKPDESPQLKVKIAPFWMGQFEITWNEYELFMYPDEEKRTRAAVATDAAGDKLADAMTHPSKPYVEMSFGMGKDGYPAISMTQHAANKYCQWLSAKTGHFYRLPTEAEWEYACRAGTTSSRFFGEDDSKLAEYAWYEQNSDFKYQKVGKKKPNPWGLYDIYGNVVEWVLDQYDPEFYKTSSAKGELVDPWNRATKPYPHSVRGGSWDDEASRCRSAARRGSDRSWKMQDPQLPKSIWYFSDAQWVGFRIVRPLKVPPAEEMQKYWTSGVERD